MTYFLFLAGLVLLTLGGEFLVRGAVDIAKRFSVPPLLIGLTIVGFGTSTPELLVSLQAALDGTPAIAIGNIIGSNIANILLILGLSALIFPIVMRLAHMTRDFAVMIGSTLLLWALMWNGVLGRLEGSALLVGLFIYIGVCLRDKDDTADLDEAPPALPLTIAQVVGGLVALMIGARFLVDSATEIAHAYGISEAVIGLTIVAVGTSLPELATSIVAAVRRHSEIAVGNVIGSNIFNILGILSLTAMVTPVPVEPRFVSQDMFWALGTALVLLFFAGAFGRIGRPVGAIFIAAYALYVAVMAIA